MKVPTIIHTFGRIKGGGRLGKVSAYRRIGVSAYRRMGVLGYGAAANASGSLLRDADTPIRRHTDTFFSRCLRLHSPLSS
jgi:hypothetical protein